MDWSIDFSNTKVLIIDLVLLAFVIAFTSDGWKKGMFETVIRFVGFCICAVVAYLFKDKLSVILYTHLPFIKFGGLLKVAPAINILLYEILAFILIYTVAMIIFSLFLKMTNIIDKAIMKLPIVGFFNQLAGAVIAFIESIVILYFAVFLFNAGANLFGFEVEKSWADNILKISLFDEKFGNELKSINEIGKISRDSSDEENKEELNDDVIDVLLKYNIVSKENLDLLINSGKLTYGLDHQEEVQITEGNTEGQ